MSEGHREDAMRLAHTKFVKDMQVLGFGDTIAKAKPYNECEKGAGQLIIPIEGIRDTSDLQRAIEKAGYEHRVQNDAYNDSAVFVAIVPFVQESSSAVGYYGQPRRKSRDKFFTPAKLIIALFFLVAFGLTQTPTRAWQQLFG